MIKKIGNVIVNILKAVSHQEKKGAAGNTKLNYEIHNLNNHFYS